MDEKMKTVLRQEFEPPKPLKKREFIERFPKESMSFSRFVFLQTGFIRKRVWVCSILIFMLTYISSKYMEKGLMCSISALMPLLALTAITESGRSEIYGMSELELSSRFSLKSVLLARMGILGSVNFFLIMGVILVVGFKSGTCITETALYMFCPYLATTFAGMYIVRKVRGREAEYCCAGISICISVGSVMAVKRLQVFYQQNYKIWWLLLFVSLCVGMVWECRQMVKQTEEFKWNL